MEHTSTADPTRFEYRLQLKHWINSCMLCGGLHAKNTHTHTHIHRDKCICFGNNTKTWSTRTATLDGIHTHKHTDEPCEFATMEHASCYWNFGACVVCVCVLLLAWFSMEKPVCILGCLLLLLLLLLALGAAVAVGMSVVAHCAAICRALSVSFQHVA